MKNESLDYHVKEIIKYNPDIKKLIDSNQSLKSKLESTVTSNYNRYKGVIQAGTLIDKIDKFTATIKTGLDLFGPLGKLVGLVVDVPEILAKGAYALYYSARTSDYGALPGWMALEGLSTILPFGQTLDYMNIYKNRAHKMLRKKATDQFNEYLKGYAIKDDYKSPTNIIPFPKTKKEQIKKAA